MDLAAADFTSAYTSICSLGDPCEIGHLFLQSCPWKSAAPPNAHLVGRSDYQSKVSRSHVGIVVSERG